MVLLWIFSSLEVHTVINSSSSTLYCKKSPQKKTFRSSKKENPSRALRPFAGDDGDGMERWTGKNYWWSSSVDNRISSSAPHGTWHPRRVPSLQRSIRALNPIHSRSKTKACRLRWCPPPISLPPAPPEGSERRGPEASSR